MLLNSVYKICVRGVFRQDLVAHLLEYNTKLQAGEATIQNVKRLKMKIHMLL